MLYYQKIEELEAASAVTDISDEQREEYARLLEEVLALVCECIEGLSLEK